MLKKILKFLTFSLISVIFVFNNLNSCFAQEADNKITLPDDLSIIVLSCDSYSELWYPNFEFMFKFWPSLLGENKHIPIYLLSNTLEFKNPRVNTVKVGEDTNWSSNVKKFLESVKTKYVMLLMDDYIINGPVNEKRLIELRELLEKTNGAYVEITIDNGMFSLGCEKKKDYVKGFSHVIRRSRDGCYRNSLQAALWNTDILRNLLAHGESAWQFEDKGNHRSKKLKENFYMVTDNPVVGYYNLVAKRMYEKEQVDSVNQQNVFPAGMIFSPQKMSILPRKEIEKIINDKNFKVQ